MLPDFERHDTFFIKITTHSLNFLNFYQAANLRIVRINKRGQKHFQKTDKNN